MELTAKQMQSNGGKKRWKNVPKRERSKKMSELAKIRHSKNKVKDIPKLSTV